MTVLKCRYVVPIQIFVAGDMMGTISLQHTMLWYLRRFENCLIDVQSQKRKLYLATSTMPKSLLSATRARPTIHGWNAGDNVVLGLGDSKLRIASTFGDDGQRY